MARTIVVTSGKGGVGKSSIVSLLGRKLASMHQKVVLLDADLGLKNLDVLMGLEARIVYDFEDVIRGRASISQALVQDKVEPNLFLLPACLRLDVKTIDKAAMKIVVDSLDPDFDFILVDSPAGIEMGFLNAIQCAKEALVVMTLDKASLRDADKVIGLLKANDITDINVVINRFEKEERNQAVHLAINDVKRVLGEPIIEFIPFDQELVKAQNYGLVTKVNSKANKAIERLAMTLLGCDKEEKKQNLLQRFINKVRSS